MRASEVMLLAAARLGGGREFSRDEWCVEAFKLDPQRFGMLVGNARYPDTHRCCMEIMGSKPASPVCRGFVRKTRPSTYELTPHGKKAAETLRAQLQGGKPVELPRSPNEEQFRNVATSAGFRAWLNDPSQPTDEPAFLEVILSTAFLDWLHAPECDLGIEIRASLIDYRSAMEYRFVA
jgi:hypothetical protein